MPFIIGFWCLIDRSIIPFVTALEIKSKCGVSPLITHPSAITASYFSILQEIIKGISNTPGAFNILYSNKIVEKKQYGSYPNYASVQKLIT